MTRRTLYGVAGESLLVEAGDDWAAAAIDALFAGWHLTPQGGDAQAAASAAVSMPAIVMRSDAAPAPIPAGLQAFDVAGGGTCYTDGRTSYIAIDDSVVAIGKPGLAPVEVWLDGPLPIEAPAMTRVVTYALAAALRQRRRFELHSGALLDPESGEGILIVGPSGSGKSTMAIHLASAGWPFLTDDVLLLSKADAEVTAWPLRRCVAITSETFAASRFLQARASLDDWERQVDDKHQFMPRDLFAGAHVGHCVPRTLVFPELTGAPDSRVSRLSAGDTMARLIRMNPWSCYDRSTASEHLAVLSALATQARSYALRAGRDLLDPEASVTLMAACARESWRE